jgi:hypothetical protein
MSQGIGCKVEFPKGPDLGGSGLSWLFWERSRCGVLGNRYPGLREEIGAPVLVCDSWDFSGGDYGNTGAFETRASEQGVSYL